MDPRPGTKRIAFAILLGSLVAGCMYRDPSVDLLEGELRWMEDQVFMLEDELNRKCAELAACQDGQIDETPTPAVPQHDKFDVMFGDEGTEVITPPIEIPEGEYESETPSIDLPADGNESPVTPNGQSLYEPLDTPRTDATNDDDSGYEIIEPAIELPPIDDVPGTDAGLAPTTPGANESPSELPPSTLPPALENSGNGQLQLQSYFQTTPDAAIGDAHVTHIVIRGEVSDGYDFDDRPTEPGLLVLLEPRNAAGDYVALAGPVSIVVLDGELAGDAARVARWDFDAAAARRFIRRSERGNGIHLVLPWPEDVPDSRELYLFARYTTVEGRHLESDLRLERGQSSERWQASAREKSLMKTWAIVDHPQPLVVAKSNIPLRPIPGTAHASTTRKRDGRVASQPEFPVLSELKRPEWKPDR